MLCTICSFIFSIVFNLANGIDVEITKQKIDEYKKNNQALIMKNRQKQVNIINKIGLTIPNSE